ncbi:MAG: hypothetical protein AMK75_04900 [Planctomycetes bacterium SM23_65]|nr:MAG: hypothetical protein AMK75_04900 [Planctomycetes bacterium SM23_65]
MIVTEGNRAYRQRRTLSLAVAVFLFCGFTFLLLPFLVVPAIWVCAVMATATVGRFALLSVVALFERRPADPSVEHPDRAPSIAFVIPCLNELPSLKRTVPAMTSLVSDNDIFFLYVCESASRDGTTEYLRKRARTDKRMVLLERPGSPAGRGSAVRYGVSHLPECDLVGFLDADYTLDQTSFDRLLALMGREDSPMVLQGGCEAINETSGSLPRLLSLERRWVEQMELEANPRLGGMCYFGVGQGFFQRRLFDDPRFVIDESALVDDIELSCRLALAGHKVAYEPSVVSRCLEVTSLRGYLAQRYRWLRGWLQISRKYLGRCLRTRGLSRALRADLLRFCMKPYRVGAVFITLPAFIVLSVVGSFDAMTLALLIVVLGMSLIAGVLPLITGACPLRPREIFLSLLGMSLLLFSYSALFSVAMVEEYVLRAPRQYAKTDKSNSDWVESRAGTRETLKPEEVATEEQS